MVMMKMMMVGMMMMAMMMVSYKRKHTTRISPTPLESRFCSGSAWSWTSGAALRRAAAALSWYSRDAWLKSEQLKRTTPECEA